MLIRCVSVLPITFGQYSSRTYHVSTILIAWDEGNGKYKWEPELLDTQLFDRFASAVLFAYGYAARCEVPLILSARIGDTVDIAAYRDFCKLQVVPCRLDRSAPAPEPTLDDEEA